MFAISLLFTRRKIDQKLKVPDVTIAQKLILEHRGKRRRNRHREFERHSIVHESLHHAKQRNVGLGDRLKKPLFLEEMLVLRMANEGEMRVQDEGEMARHWGRFTPSFRAKSRNPDAILEIMPRSARLRFAPLGMTAQSVRQKSWNRSNPFLITSRLVA
jgi:hypothetical protein